MLDIDDGLKMAMSPRSGQQISLDALRAAYNKLQATAERAKREADEFLEWGTEATAIHTEFTEIVHSKEHGDHIDKKLVALEKRRAKLDRIKKKDFMKLIDQQMEAEMERDNLGCEINLMEFRIRSTESEIGKWKVMKNG